MRSWNKRKKSFGIFYKEKYEDEETVPTTIAIILEKRLINKIEKSQCTELSAMTLIKDKRFTCDIQKHGRFMQSKNFSPFSSQTVYQIYDVVK